MQKKSLRPVSGGDSQYKIISASLKVFPLFSLKRYTNILFSSGELEDKKWCVFTSEIVFF
jgi:hypothetical protein